MTNETLQVIKNRRSTRIFLTEQIKNEEIKTIIEAGAYAPSAHNEQSWYFVVVQNKDLLDELNTVSKEVAKDHPDSFIKKLANHERFHAFFHAPTVIIVCGKETSIMPELDCAAATQNMLLAAESINVGACWVGFVTFLFNSDEGKIYIEKLNIPKGYKPYYAVALGYKKTKDAKAPARKEKAYHLIK